MILKKKSLRLRGSEHCGRGYDGSFKSGKKGGKGWAGNKKHKKFDKAFVSYKTNKKLRANKIRRKNLIYLSDIIRNNLSNKQLKTIKKHWQESSTTKIIEVKKNSKLVIDNKSRDLALKKQIDQITIKRQKSSKEEPKTRCLKY